MTLTATVEPEDTTDKTLTWSSSDEKVATVENGVVTAIATGTAIITATTSNGLKAECELTVTGRPVKIESIEIDSTEMFDIYTMNGMLIKKNANGDFLSTLAKGIYIINYSGTSYRVVK